MKPTTVAVVPVRLASAITDVVTGIATATISMIANITYRTFPPIPPSIVISLPVIGYLYSCIYSFRNTYIYILVSR